MAGRQIIGRQTIDWSFFSMMRYLLTAVPAGTARITPAQRRRVLDERLRQVTRLQGS